MPTSGGTPSRCRSSSVRTGGLGSGEVGYPGQAGGYLVGIAAGFRGISSVTASGTISMVTGKVPRNSPSASTCMGLRGGAEGGALDSGAIDKLDGRGILMAAEPDRGHEAKVGDATASLEGDGVQGRLADGSIWDEVPHKTAEVGDANGEDLRDAFQAWHGTASFGE